METLDCLYLRINIVPLPGINSKHAVFQSAMIYTPTAKSTEPSVVETMKPSIPNIWYITS